ncbi:MAG: AAA family ATPase [Rhizobiales bacterium]|nr:AAA family ATPase [Hyphomicrobiales bacterium]
MAPTTDAALTLGKAIGAEGRTVARHLSRVSRVRPSGADKAPVWIVDEASMVSAKTMRDLIRAAEQHGARLFLVFDVLQLGSVGAGRAAGQLIEQGMHTHYLDAIVRQAAEPRLVEAVYDMIRREPGRRCSSSKPVAAGFSRSTVTMSSAASVLGIKPWPGSMSVDRRGIARRAW